MLTACHILDTGYCLASEHHLIAGGARRTVACHSLVALLHHARHGWLLWDAGYASRLFDSLARFPYSLYRRATPLCLSAELALPVQLARRGLAPADISHVLLSHFHADHVAGLRDFPGARLVATREAWKAVAGRTGFGALRRAFVPSLLPNDFASRATLLPPFDGLDLPPLGPTHDLFGDGSLRLVALPGHARGQMGLYAELSHKGPFLFTADAAYLTRAIHENRSAHPLTNVFADDARQARQTLARLHAFAKARPDVTLVPTHCSDAYQRFVASGQP